MTRRGLLVALAVVVAVNLGVLVGVARNRAGEPESTLLLDERELVLVRRPADDSTIRLRWNVPREARPGGPTPAFLPSWIDQHKLETLGFDCSVPAGDRDAEAFYRSIPPRKVIVVLEFAGPSWSEHVARWQERSRADLERLRASRVVRADEDASYQRAIETATDHVSRLLPVDVGLDPEALRAHYPDRSRYLFLQAVVRLYLDPGAGGGKPTLVGRIVEWLPAEVTVPRAGRAAISGLPPTSVTSMPGVAEAGFPDSYSVARIDTQPRYRVRVKVGHLLQPWIDEVSAAPAHGGVLQP